MFPRLKKIHHLIRYFLLLGIASFVAYLKAWNDEITFYLIGPPVYLGYFLKSGLTRLIPAIPADASFNHYAVLLPLILFYFGMVGTLLKILWNETGNMRLPTFFAFCGFLIFIHYFSAGILLGYYKLYP